MLEAQIAAGGGRFRGIRHQRLVGRRATQVRNGRAASRPQRALLATPDFREGFADSHRAASPSMRWCYHPQLPELTELARAFPETTIVLNHFGRPLGIGPYAGKRDEVFGAWRPDRRARDVPERRAKLGGIPMASTASAGTRARAAVEPKSSWRRRALLRHAIEHFGADRCMFESNFPVDKMTCSYTVLWNPFKRLTAGYCAAEKAALFHDTAARVYRLDDGA